MLLILQSISSYQKHFREIGFPDNNFVSYGCYFAIKVFASKLCGLNRHWEEKFAIVLPCSSMYVNRACLRSEQVCS